MARKQLLAEGGGEYIQEVTAEHKILHKWGMFDVHEIRHKW